MEISPAVAAPPGATPGTTMERPLPALVMEDAAVAERQAHGLRGKLFYGFSYFAAAALAFGAVMLGITGLVNLEPVYLALGAGAGLWAALQWRLAREVHHFTRWGWYGAMGEMSLVSAAKVWAMAQGEPLAGLSGLIVDALVLSYFWKRRADFDIGTGL